MNLRLNMQKGRLQIKSKIATEKFINEGSKAGKSWIKNEKPRQAGGFQPED